MTTIDLSKKLTVVIEGGAHMFEYLFQNGVNPSSIILSPVKFKEVAPYLGSDDVVLVIIKGLTDFSLAEVYGLIEDLEVVKPKVAEVTLLSNIDLGEIEMPYYLYSGDLFYGSVTQVLKGKKLNVSTSRPDKQKKEDKKKTSDGKKYIEQMEINTVMGRYKIFNKKYNNTDNKPKVYGSEKPVTFEASTTEDLLVKSIVFVDAFGGS